MKAIILAAGYGKRLDEDITNLKNGNKERYEEIKHCIEGKSKATVLVAGKPVIEYITENIEGINGAKRIEQIYVVTNNKFFRQINEWRDSHKGHEGSEGSIPIKLINDNTNSNDERLGAVKDLLLALNKEEIDDDILVVAGDNLIKFDLSELVNYFERKKTSVLVVYKESDREKIRKSACVEIDEHNLVVGFEEKPKEPRSEWICPAIYIFSKDTVKLIKEMRFSEDKKDLIGNIPMMLYNKIFFYAFKKDSKIRFDLGTVKDFEEAERYFGGKGR